MNKWIKVARWVTCLSCVFGTTGRAIAQAEHLIENDRAVIISNTTWGATYVGKYTSNNGLYLTNANVTLSSGDIYVGALDSSSGNEVLVAASNAVWTAGSLTLGSTNNTGNSVIVADLGELNLSGGVLIEGATNTLTLGQNGTLSVGDSFNASMAGFIYEGTNTLKVGGVLSGMDSVELTRTVDVSGAAARWEFSTNTFRIGETSSSNTVVLGGGAVATVSNVVLGAGGDGSALDISGGSELTADQFSMGTGGDANSVNLSGGFLGTGDLLIGAAGTKSNLMTVADGGRVSITDSLTIAGAGTSLQVANGGWLEVDMDFDANMTGFELQTGGGLEVHRNLSMNSMTNGVNVVLNGTNALWDRTGLALNIGSSTNDGNNGLVVNNGAQAWAGQLTMSGDGNLLQVSGSNALLAASGDMTFVGSNLSLDVLDGGTLTNGGTFGMTGDGNLLQVSGSNALLAASGDMTFVGSNLSLDVLDGGTLTNGGTFGMTGDRSSLQVSGTNSLLTASGDMTFAGTDLSIDVIDGGALTSGGAFDMSGADNSELTVGGNIQVDQLLVGSLSNQNNSVLISNGGNLVLEGLGSFIHNTNSLTLINGGRLTVKEDFDSAISWADGTNSQGTAGSGAQFIWADGGILECQGLAPVSGAYKVNGEYTEIGKLFLRDGQILMLNGSNALWQAAGDELHIGDLSSGNALVVTNEGSVVVNTMTVGDFKEGGDGNYVLISGTNSSIYSAGDVEFGGRILNGSWVDGGSGNQLAIENGGALITDGDFLIGGSNNTFLMDGASVLDVAGNFTVNGNGQRVAFVEGAAFTNAGFSACGDGNTFQVEGAGSELSNSGDMIFCGADTYVGVTTGGLVSAGGILSITGGGDGQLYLSGTNSLVSAGGDVLINHSNTTTMAVYNGASLTNNGSIQLSGAVVSVQLENGSIQNSGDFTLTSADSATLTLDNSTLSGVSNFSMSGTSTMVLLDSSAMTNSGTFTVAAAGDTHLLVSTNGLLSTGGDMLVTGSNGVVGVVAGGRVLNGGAFSMTNSGTTTLLVDEGTFSNAGGLTVVGSDTLNLMVDGASAALTAQGDVTLAGTDISIDVLDGAMLTNSGTFSVAAVGDTRLLVSTNGLLSTGGDMLVTGSNGVVGVVAGGRVINGGAFSMTNSGTTTVLVDEGTFSNAGGLTVVGSDTLDLLVDGASAALTAQGDVALAGTDVSIDVLDGATLTNSGMFSVAATGDTDLLISTNGLLSTGDDMLVTGSNGVVGVVAGGRVLNGGAFSMTNSGTTTVLVDEGTFSNAGGLTVVGSDTLDLLVDGASAALTAQGNVALAGTDVSIDVLDGATLTNSGMFSVAAAGDTHLLVSANSLLSTDGDMLVTGDNGFIGVRAGGRLSNGGSLSMTNGGRTTLLIDDSIFSNAGALSVIGSDTLNLLVDGASAELTAQGDVTLSGTDVSVNVLDGAMLTNSGRFSVTAVGNTRLLVSANSLLSTDGDMLVTGDNGFVGVRAGGRLSNGGAFSMTNSGTTTLLVDEGTFSNAGGLTVVGSDTLDLLVDGASAELTAQGDVTLAGTDVSVDVLDGATLTNSGTFSVAATGDTRLLVSANGLLSTGGDMLVTGDNAFIEVIAGGRLINGGALSVAGTESSLFYVAGAGSELTAQGDVTLSGTDVSVNVLDGALLTNSGTFSMIGDDGIVIVDGGNSLLSAAGDIMIIGSSNRISVSDNGFVESGGDFSMAGMGSSINIDSTSRLETAGDISLDGVRLEIANGGQITSGGTLYNKSTLASSEIFLGHGSVINATNYYQDAGAILNYNIGSVPTNLGILRIAETAEFEAGAKLGLLGSLTNLTFDTTYTNMLVRAESLIVGGRTNVVSDDLALLDISGSTLVDFQLFVDEQDIYTILNRKSLADSAGFDSDGMMGDIANEIDGLSLNGNSAAANQIDILSGMTGSQQNQQLNQLYAYSLPTFMHAQGMLNGIDQARARGRSAGTAAPIRPAPAGAAGPHAGDQGLQGWTKVYGGFGNRDGGEASSQDGYAVQTFGTILGLDQAFDSWLFGLAGGYAGSNLSGDNGDKSDATTSYGILYANYGAEEWFGDLVLGLGSMGIENTSGTDFDVKSSVDASQTSFYIGGGKQVLDEKSGMLLSSLLGLQVYEYSQDAYTETSTTALGKAVDAYERLSCQSKFGISITHPTEGLKVNLESNFRAFWLHEFNGDNETVGYKLVDSSNLPGQFTMRSPDQDIGLFGLGLMTKWNNGLRFRVDIDAQLSKSFYSTSFSGSVLYEF